MNPGIKLVTVYVAGALLVAGCGQSNSGSAGTSPGQPAAAAKPAAPKDASIKVKGLYIGMDIQTVPALLKKSLPPDFAGDVSDVTKVELLGNFPIVIFGGDVIVTAELDGKVNKIILNTSLASHLFNSADMDASAFVQQFANSYHIPEMKVSDDRQFWTYTSPDGVKVTIDTTKAVMLEIVASAQDHKQSFN